MTREERLNKITEKALAGPKQGLPARVLALMEHGYSYVRWWALDQLWGMGGKEARMAARIGVGDPNLSVRDDAVMMLADIGNRSDTHRLLMAARDDEWTVRCSAMFALGEIGGMRAYREVVKGLKKDPHFVVRAWAATALSHYPEAQPVLEQALLEEDDAHARLDIVNSLVVLGRRDLIPQLANFLTDDWHCTRSVAVRYISELTQEERAPLMPALKAAIDADLFAGANRDEAEKLLISTPTSSPIQK